MPSELTQFLTLDEVLAIHQRSLQRFGGSGGVRDMGLLESALYRPRTGYYADLVEMAAAMFESLLMNHPFVDGYKRVAFFATDVFLRMNGWRIRVGAAAADRFVRGSLERREVDHARITAWLREHVERMP